MTQLALSADIIGAGKSAGRRPLAASTTAKRVSRARRWGRYDLFYRRYMIHRNGTRAAIEAGYSEKSAHVTASRLLKNPKVQALIAGLTEQQTRNLEISSERVMKELGCVAFANMANYLGENGTVTDVPNLTEDCAAAIQELTVDRKAVVIAGEKRAVLRTRLKLFPKIQALELLARILGMVKEKPEDPGAALARLSDDELRARAEQMGVPVNSLPALMEAR